LIENTLASITVAADGTLVIDISVAVYAFVIVGIVLFVVFRLITRGFFKDLFLDEVSLNFRGQEVRFRPNADDRIIAYKTWVEIKTRKLGVVYTEKDVLSEIYDSWYAFFGVSRELLKTFPIQKINHAGGRQTIDILLSILNDELRPHLNSWHARYRKWLLEELEKDVSNGKSPQEIQRAFPEYEQLVFELKLVNSEMINFASELEKIFRRES